MNGAPDESRGPLSRPTGPAGSRAGDVVATSPALHRRNRRARSLARPRGISPTARHRGHGPSWAAGARRHRRRPDRRCAWRWYRRGAMGRPRTRIGRLRRCPGGGHPQSTRHPAGAGTHGDLVPAPPPPRTAACDGHLGLAGGGDLPVTPGRPDPSEPPQAGTIPARRRFTPSPPGRWRPDEPARRPVSAARRGATAVKQAPPGGGTGARVPPEAMGEPACGAARWICRRPSSSLPWPMGRARRAARRAGRPRRAAIDPNGRTALWRPGPAHRRRWHLGGPRRGATERVPAVLGAPLPRIGHGS